jgi:hypothetical protein
MKLLLLKQYEDKRSRRELKKEFHKILRKGTYRFEVPKVEFYEQDPTSFISNLVARKFSLSLHL